jgi:hypothetical protein
VAVAVAVEAVEASAAAWQPPSRQLLLLLRRLDLLLPWP